MKPIVRQRVYTCNCITITQDVNYVIIIDAIMVTRGIGINVGLHGGFSVGGRIHGVEHVMDLIPETGSLGIGACVGAGLLVGASASTGGGEGNIGGGLGVKFNLGYSVTTMQILKVYYDISEQQLDPSSRQTIANEECAIKEPVPPRLPM
jgi:hypothetical protein